MDSTDILINIRKIVRSINLESKRIEKDYGVSIPQVLCMDYLSKSPEFQATQGELKNFLNLNSSTVSGIVQRLEKKGLIARLPKTGDKRVTKLILTAPGEMLLRKIPPLLHDKLNRQLETINNKELQKIEEVLNNLILFLQIPDEDVALPIISNNEL
ncbi:MAG: MarR family transcriptional regulator [Prolixibacteraceae bacterium]|nr:MarR family transcriptional regulator [Prolixibacteraceae bacterium]